MRLPGLGSCEVQLLGQSLWQALELLEPLDPSAAQDTCCCPFPPPQPTAPCSSRWQIRTRQGASANAQPRSPQSRGLTSSLLPTCSLAGCALQHLHASIHSRGSASGWCHQSRLAGQQPELKMGNS